MEKSKNGYGSVILEIVINAVIIATAFLIGSFTWQSIGSDHSVNHNLADILAEILGLIFVLPQVVVQLATKNRQNDLRTVFKSSVSFYLLFYVFAIIVLSYDFIFLLLSDKWGDVLCITIFIAALFQIAPYLYFFIKKHSPSSEINILKKKILKRAKKLANLAKKQSQGEKVKKLRKASLSDIARFEELILSYEDKDTEMVKLGAEVLVSIIEKLHEYENKGIDDFLLTVIEVIGEIGANIKDGANTEIILNSLKETAQYVINGNCTPDRMTKFVLPMIAKITDISLSNSERLSEMAIIKSIKFIDEISTTALRYKPAEKKVVESRKIEYHNIVVQLNRFGMFSLAQHYDYATSEVFNSLNRMSQLSLKYLPRNTSPVLKIADAMADLGKIASQEKNENYVFEAFNSLDQIIATVTCDPEDLKYCVACFMQLGGAVYQNMPEIEQWLCKKMRSLEENTKINLIEFFKSSEDIISDKSEIERIWFLDFLDFLKDCLGITDDEEPEDEEE